MERGAAAQLRVSTSRRTEVNVDMRQCDKLSSITARQNTMSEAMYTSWGVKRFTGDAVEYRAWSYKMECVLLLEGSWKYVNGQLPKPVADETNAAAIEDWEEGDAIATAHIKLSIADSYITKLPRADTSKQLWDRLALLYQPSSVTCGWLFKELWGTKKGNRTMVEYLGDRNDIRDRLCASGHDVDDEYFILATHAGLLPDHEQFISRLDEKEKPDPDKALDENTKALITFEQIRSCFDDAARTQHDQGRPSSSSSN